MKPFKVWLKWLRLFLFSFLIIIHMFKADIP